MSTQERYYTLMGKNSTEVWARTGQGWKEGK